MIDPRGPRFAAAVTTLVLAVVLIADSPWLLAAQTVVFAIAATRGPAASPYGYLFARVIRPRIKPPAELEAAAPPKFAQAVGLGFSLVGLVGYLFAAPIVVYIAVAAALAAAFLNAAFGFCLGCEFYLAYRRFVTARNNNTPEVTP